MDKQSFVRSLSCIMFLGALLFAHNVNGSQTKHYSHINDIPPGFVSIGGLKPTFYWVALESHTSDPRNKEVRDLYGNVLANVTEKYWADITMEGTGKLLDGRILNFAGFVIGPNGREIRFLECGPDAPYGYGLGERKLVPFRSVAVDPNVIPLDSLVFLPQAKGAILPDGSIHDGIFQAVDIGEAIQNLRIDVFTSYGDQSEIFTRHGLISMRWTPVYVKRVTHKYRVRRHR